MTSRNAYMTSRFSVPASAGPLLPLVYIDCCFLTVLLSQWIDLRAVVLYLSMDYQS